MKNRAGAEAGGFSGKRFGLRRRGPNALSAKNCFLDRVIMQARAPISTFSLFSCFCVFFTRRFGLRRRGPNTHSSQNSSICGVLDVLVLIKWLGSGKYTKSTIFTAPIFQNDAPACIITPSGSSRGALLALFETLS